MKRIVILADDMTGVVDTAVQFSKQGIPACVWRLPRRGVPLSCEVTAINLELRHLPAPEVHARMYIAAREALAQGADILYVKTDSGLRGSIGVAISAASQASGKGVLYVPAYPAMRRYTHGGVYYIDGQSVSKSVFGRDLYNVVRCDNLVELLHNQGVNRVRCVAQIDSMIPQSEETIIADVRTEEELSAIARRICGAQSPLVLAGCAGFAAHLPTVAGMKTGNARADIPRADRMMIVTGSVADQTFRQLRHLCNREGVCYSLGKLQADGHTPDDIAAMLAKSPYRCVVLASSLSPEEFNHNLKAERFSGENLLRRGAQIANILGETAARILKSGWSGMMMVIGGDTFFATLSCLGCDTLIPWAELSAGVALSNCLCADGSHWLISKAGSFGGENVLEVIARAILCPDSCCDP